MRATRVTTYGGGHYVQHWSLYVDSEYVADTSNPKQAKLFERIVRAVTDEHDYQAPPVKPYEDD